jgi:hypothetical protein
VVRRFGEDHDRGEEAAGAYQRLDEIGHRVRTGRRADAGSVRPDLPPRPAGILDRAKFPLAWRLGGDMANHLYYGNNLLILRDKVANESVDLIYLQYMELLDSQGRRLPHRRRARGQPGIDAASFTRSHARCGRPSSASSKGPTRRIR